MLIDLDVAKAHLRIDHGDEDTLIQLYIDAAQEQIESHLQLRVQDMPADPAEPVPDGFVRVNAALQAAALLTIAHLYEHRESVTDGAVVELPMGYWSLIQPYRLMGV